MLGNFEYLHKHWLFENYSAQSYTLENKECKHIIKIVMVVVVIIIIIVVTVIIIIITTTTTTIM